MPEDVILQRRQLLRAQLLAFSPMLAGSGYALYLVSMDHWRAARFLSDDNTGTYHQLAAYAALCVLSVITLYILRLGRLALRPHPAQLLLPVLAILGPLATLFVAEKFVTERAYTSTFILNPAPLIVFFYGMILLTVFSAWVQSGRAAKLDAP